jgi:chromosome segregation ATPase
MTYTVAEVAKRCGVTDRAIRAFCVKEDIGSFVGRTRKLSAEEAEYVIRHYSATAEDAEAASEATSEDVESVTEDAEAVSEDVEADAEAVPQDDYLGTIEQLKARLQEKESEVSFLRKQVESQNKTIDALTANVGKLTEQNQALTFENAAFASRLLGAPREEEIIDVVADPQPTEEHAGGMEEPPQEQRPQGFLEWIKSLFS